MNSLSQALHTLSYMGLPLLMAMVFHEYAHGWTANYYGDPTARLQGRLTLNPLAHIDPFGTVILPMMCLLMPGDFLSDGQNPSRSTRGNCATRARTWRSSQRPDRE